MILMAARASRTENQDAIDTAIVGMLADPKEVYWSLYIIYIYIYILVFVTLVHLFSLFFLLTTKKARDGIQEVHFLPFNPTDKRTALTYIDNESKMHRVSKGAPEQVLMLF